MKFLNKIQQSKEFWFLLATGVIFFLLRLPSLFEPYWYGDEGIYEVIGFALRHGRLLYSGIWDNKPPMLYLIYALFSGDQTAAKFLSLLAGLFATWAIFFLSKKLFTKLLPSAITTGIFAFLFGIPFIEGNIANAENFMLFPTILAGILVLVSVQTDHKTKNRSLYQILNTKYFILLVSGLLLGLSFLTKVVAMFDLAAFAVFLFLVTLDKLSVQNIVQSVKKVVPLVVGFCIPIVLCAGFFMLHHTFSIFLHATLFSNVSYVNYGNQFLIPQGFLILKTLLVGIGVLFFLLRRKNIAKDTLFIFIWIIFALYSSLFSGRPYTHYALVLLPSVSLLVGLFVLKKTFRLIIGITLILLLVFIGKSFLFYPHVFGYYENFSQFVVGVKSPTEYRAFFDSVTPRDYALAEFIQANRKDNQTLFVWGNSGQIYKLANTLPPGRFIVAYHMTMTPQNLLETQEVLGKNPPTFLILLPNQSGIPISLAHYQERLMIQGATLYEHVL